MQIVNSKHPAVRYAHDVLDGRVVVGQLLRLAVERDLYDQETASERGLIFDEAAADKRVRWFNHCRQIDGEFEGLPLILEPWQAWFTWVSYGWLWEDTGFRRYHRRWLEVASGNGKTTWMGGDALGQLVIDGEGGAEIYPVATHRAQSKILWSAAARMIEQSPALQKHLRLFDSVNNQRILFPGRNAFMVPLGKVSGAVSHEGKKPHGLYFDEVHEYKDRTQWIVLHKKMFKRRQPMSTAMTTADGGEPESLYEDVHNIAIEVLKGWQNGDFVDDGFMVAIYAIDDDDDPYAEGTTEDEVVEMLKKANPNMGVNIQCEDLVDQWQRGHRDPTEKASLLRFSCNRRTSTNVHEFSSELWDSCADRAIDWDDFIDRPYVGAFDLSSTRDLTAISLMYWHENRPWYRWFCFLPKERLAQKCADDLIDYERWAKEGWLTLTPGDQIDDEMIVNKIQEIDGENRARQWTADPAHSKFVMNGLARGEASIEVVLFKQDLLTFAEPVMHFIDELCAGKMRHDGNPLVRWCATNAVTKEDNYGNRLWHKKASRKRIDPIVAATMARGRAIVLDLDSDDDDAWDGSIELW